MTKVIRQAACSAKARVKTNMCVYTIKGTFLLNKLIVPHNVIQAVFCPLLSPMSNTSYMEKHMLFWWILRNLPSPPQKRSFNFRDNRTRAHTHTHTHTLRLSRNVYAFRVMLLLLWIQPIGSTGGTKGRVSVQTLHDWIRDGITWWSDAFFWVKTSTVRAAVPLARHRMAAKSINRYDNSILKCQ